MRWDHDIIMLYIFLRWSDVTPKTGLRKILLLLFRHIVYWLVIYDHDISHQWNWSSMGFSNFIFQSGGICLTLISSEYHLELKSRIIVIIKINRTGQFLTGLCHLITVPTATFQFQLILIATNFCLQYLKHVFFRDKSYSMSSSG